MSPRKTAPAAPPYQVWRDYVPGGEFASAFLEQGITDEQVDDIRWARPLRQPISCAVITTLNRGKIPDVMSSSWRGRYVSRAAREFIEKACPRDVVRFYPARMERFPKREFWLMHVLALRSSFDWKRSRYTTFDDAPKILETVRKLVLTPVPADAPAVFGMEELLCTYLVRDDLREALVKSLEFPGDFVPVDRFKFGV